MKRHWLYAACVGGALAAWVIFLCGFFGGWMYRWRMEEPPVVREPPAAITRGNDTQADPRDIAAVILSEPTAKQIFDATASDKNSELSVWRYPSVVRISAGGHTLFSSHEPEAFAKAKEELANLIEADLLTGSRRIRTSEGYEREVYSLTTLGHSIAKQQKAE